MPSCETNVIICSNQIATKAVILFLAYSYVATI